MAGKTPVSFDRETVTVLREILDDAWARLRPAQQATMLRTTLAERILQMCSSGRTRPRALDGRRPRERPRRLMAA